MRKPPAGLMIVLTLAVAAAMVAFVIRKTDKSGETVRIGFQDADEPLAMPEKGAPDHRFDSLLAWDVARIPAATRFDSPMGSENGGLAYNAQSFMEPNPGRGGPHFGDDLNGIGGMNTDLGDPVFASGDGLVIYAGEPSSGWGNTIILAHRTMEGMLHSMYAHLNRIDVPLGALVSRGQRIGTVGTANGHYPAHLHLEFRNSDLPDIGPGYGDDPLNRIDPHATIARLRGAAPDDLSPAPLELVLLDPDRWTELEIEGADRMPGLSPDAKSPTPHE